MSIKTVNSAAFTDSSILQVYKITIENASETVIFPVDDIITLELHFNDDIAVKGSLTIRDNADLFNLMQLNFSTDTFVKIEAKDIYDTEFKKTFNILGLSQAKENQKFTVFTIDLVDDFFYALNNTYISKSYNDTLSNILTDYLKHLNIKEKKELAFNITSTTIKKSRIVPQHISFLEWITKELKKENYKLLQTRDTIFLSKILKAKEYPLSINKLTQIAYNAEYTFKIHDVNGTVNIYELNKNIPNSVNYYNTTIKEMQNSNINVKDTYSGLNNFDNTTFLEHTNGSKYIYNTDTLTTIDKLKYEELNTIKLTVTGNFTYFFVDTNYQVDLLGNLNHTQGQHQGDIVQSGIYTCKKITDRYIGNRTVQQLILRRIDYNTKV